MGRWTAPSDLDYWDEVEGRSRDGIERSCHGCHAPVMVSRDEAYLVQVFCEHCIRKAETLKANAQYQAARRKQGAA